MARPQGKTFRPKRCQTREEGQVPNITIQWCAGRTEQQRREIVKAITDAMVKIGKTTPD